MHTFLEETTLLFYHCLPSQWGSTLKRKNFLLEEKIVAFNPFALRKAKIVYNFGLSECNRVKSRLICRRSVFVEGIKQELIKVVSLCKNGRKT